MKYLWTRRPNNILLVRIKLKERKSFAVPVSVWVLEITLESLSDLVRVCERIIQVRGKDSLIWTKNPNKRLAKWIPDLSAAPFSSSLRLIEEILKDLRKQGKFRMIEVKDGDTHVMVDLL